MTDLKDFKDMSEAERNEAVLKYGKKLDETVYVAVINYDYQVDGNAYTSNKVAFGGQSGTQANVLVNRYSKGASVDVFYDPENPKEAVLETGMKKGSYFFPIFGGVFILFGLVLAYKGMKTGDIS